jgi:hypothetical protein
MDEDQKQFLNKVWEKNNSPKIYFGSVTENYDYGSSEEKEKVSPATKWTMRIAAGLFTIVCFLIKFLQVNPTWLYIFTSLALIFLSLVSGCLLAVYKEKNLAVIAIVTGLFLLVVSRSDFSYGELIKMLVESANKKAEPCK